MEKDLINTRILDALAYILDTNKELTKTELAQSFGIKPAKFTEILKGRMYAGTEIMAKLNAIYGISALWLLSGNGGMFAQDHAEKKSCGDPIIDRLLAMIDEKDAVIREQAEELGQLRERLTRQGGNADAADNTPAARAV